MIKFVILFSVILYLQNLGNSKACSFNCGSVSSDKYSIIIKPPAHTGFKKHSFPNGPVKKHSFSYIKDASNARAGKAFQRFELRDGDCFPDRSGRWNDCKMNRERFEFHSKPRQKPIGKQCYGYSIKLDKNFRSLNPTNTDIGQVHQQGGPKGTAKGLKSFPPIIQIGAKYNVVYLGWHKLSGDPKKVIAKRIDHSLAKISDMRNVWTDISFCLDFKNKRIDAWVNGKKKVEILQSPIRFKPEKIYFKYGIYRSFISRFKDKILKDPNGKMPTQIVYYDEIRRGNSIEEVDMNLNPNLKIVD